MSYETQRQFFPKSVNHIDNAPQNSTSVFDGQNQLTQIICLHLGRLRGRLAYLGQIGSFPRGFG